MKKLLLLALASLVSLGLLPMTAAGADGTSDEAGFVAQINALRATKGLPALAVDAGLTSKARSWAQTMADANKIWHSVLSDGITADWQRLGENVGMGGSVDVLHIAFVNSPHHYDNLVDPGFDSIGIGVVRGAGGTLFVAEEFMQTRAAAVAPVVQPAVVSPSTTSTVRVAAPRIVPAPTATTAPRAATTPTTVTYARANTPAAAEAPAGTVTDQMPTNAGVKAMPPLGGPIGNQRWACAW